MVGVAVRCGRSLVEGRGIRKVVVAHARKEKAGVSVAVAVGVAGEPGIRPSHPQPRGR